MNSADFLKLIGAPWSAYHDHPDAATAPAIAFIRTTGASYGDMEHAMIIGTRNEPAQRARRDLIAAAPTLYEYVARQAAVGDTEARMLLQSIHRGEQ